MLINVTQIFLKNRKTKSENIVKNNIKILPEDEKQRQVEYHINYCKMRKNRTASKIKTP